MSVLGYGQYRSPGNSYSVTAERIAQTCSTEAIIGSALAANLGRSRLDVEEHTF